MKTIMVVALAAILSGVAWAQGKTMGGQAGRYVITPGLHDSPLGALLLDSATGRTWMLKMEQINVPAIGTQTVAVWEPMMDPRQ